MMHAPRRSVAAANVGDERSWADALAARFAGSSPWLGAFALFVCAGALLALVPLWAPMVLAAWTAIVTWPLQRRLARRFHNRHRAAGIVTSAVVLATLTPIVLVVALSASDAIALVRRVLASGGAKSALRAIVDTPKAGSNTVNQMRQLVQEHGARAWQALSSVLGATATALIGVIVFVMFVYVFLVDGKRFLSWFEERVPIPPGVFGRLACAFAETGRGLFLGIGMTALIQGVLAGIGYYALGISQAVALGALTVIASLFPMGGSALVWVPVTIGLLLAGRPGAALIMLAIGIFVSTVDNLIRPALARRGHLDLPTSIVFAAMLGGIAMFGAWGLLLGPLFVRMAVEFLNILRERRAGGSA